MSRELRKHLDHLRVLTNELNDRDTKIKNLNKALSHKLLVLSNPAIDDVKDLKLTDIIDIELLQQIQDGFSYSFNIGSVIYDENGVPITEPSNFSSFCQLLRTSKIGLHKCELSKKRHGEVAAEAKGKPILDACMNFPELMDGTITLTIEGRKVGSLCAGQMLVEPLDENKVRKYAKEIGVDPKELIKRSKLLPSSTLEQFKKIVRFLHIICETIGILGLQNIQQAREISKRINIEKELAEYEEIYFNIFQMASDIFTILDLDGNIKAANRKACLISNYSHEELLKMNAKDLIVQTHLFDEAVQNIKEKKDYSANSTCIKKDGSTFETGNHVVRIQFMGNPHLLIISRIL
ncbi:MAG: PocR ligand-binding domain-containing protein [Promethearchaeota archaeon]